MRNIKRKYNRKELKNIDELNLSRRELVSWGTGIIADARREEEKKWRKYIESRKKRRLSNHVKSR